MTNILNLLEHYYMPCSIYRIFKQSICHQTKRVAITLKNNKLYITFDKTKMHSFHTSLKYMLIKIQDVSQTTIMLKKASFKPYDLKIVIK